MDFDLEKALKEREERVSKIVLDEELIPALKYESKMIYEDLLRTKDIISTIHFVNSWKPIEVFFEIIQEEINNTNGIHSDVSYEYYENDYSSTDNSSDNYILYFKPHCLYKYYGSSLSFEYSIEVEINEDSFDSNEFIKKIVDRIDASNEKDIYNTLDYQARYNIDYSGDKAVYSLLSVKHINELFEMHQSTYVYPYLGNSEIMDLNTALIDNLNVGNELSIERGKNFVCGNNALYLKANNEYIGCLPEDFGRFLSYGIESRYIIAKAKITEIETNTYKATKKYRVEKPKKDKTNRVCVDVKIYKGEGLHKGE